MKYRVHGEDDDHYYIEHPDKSLFSLLKHGLHDDVHARIKALRFAEGGEVPEEEELPWVKAEKEANAGKIGVSELEQPEQPFSMDRMIGGFGPNINAQPASSPMMASNDPMLDKTQLANMAGAPPPAPEGLDSSVGRVTASAEQAAANPAPGPAKAQDPFSDYAKAFGMERQGIQDIAKAKAIEGQATAQAYDANAKAMAKLQAETQARLATIDQENEVLKKQVMDGKIDPNRLWNNMSLGSKAAASIGLILGGMGQALMKSDKNAALEVLNRAIDQDIEAQKQNLNKSSTLLSQNMQKYRDIQQAEAATRMQMMASLQAQIGRAAAQSGSQQALANAKMAGGELALKEKLYKEQIVQSQLQKQAMQSLIGGAPMDAATMQFVPKEVRERYVEGPGWRGVVHGTADSAQKLRDEVGAVMAADKSIKRLIEIGKDGGRQFTPSDLKAEAGVLRTALIGALRVSMTGPGAMSESEQKLLKDVIANPTEIFQVGSEKKLETLMSIMHKSAAAKAQANGIRVQSYGFKKAE